MAKKTNNKSTSKNNEVKIEKKESQEKKIKSVDSKVVKQKNSFFLNFLILLILISSLGYFSVSLLNFNSLGDVVNGLLMVGISIFLIAACFTNPSKKKGTSYLALLTLFIYQVLGCLVSLEVITWPSNVVDNFVGKSLTEVVEWSSSNKIKLIQEYEYSDMIPEYYVINQNILPGVKLNSIEDLIVVISEGPSPYKEIVLPNMIGWDTERVLDFIKENHLINVVVEFVPGTENENTLISQSRSGNVRRNEEIKLTFSYGEERHYSEVKLIDLTNKGKFEAEFYLKQYGITYEFDYDFSDKVKRGNVMRQ
ncbi:MAG: PASTA domain-containing protein, partial [bacterium]|nr:PASTA domain-containing protein [bacterium]